MSKNFIKAGFIFFILFSTLIAQDKFKTMDEALVRNNVHHTEHFALYGKDVPEFNAAVLKGIDIVQATAPDGGGYFAFGKDSIPPESPIGYEIVFANKSLITPPRTTSYCSGSTYAVLIEALKIILGEKTEEIDAERLEALRLQEPDGGRREDDIKAWGKWNDDGPGSEFSGVQYLGICDRIKPAELAPGDFVNLSWKKGGGHSIVFLGWYKDKDGKKFMQYFSSQKSTNGMSDQLVPLDNIKEIVAVRLTKPENIFKFDPEQKTNRATKYDTIDWR